MAHSDELRSAVQEAVDEGGAEEVGRQIGVSGEQVRQFLAKPGRTLRATESAKYGKWLRERGKAPAGWQPAIKLAVYAEGVLEVLEDAAKRQRSLVEQLRALSPDPNAATRSEAIKTLRKTDAADKERAAKQSDAEHQRKSGP